jgi:hypothetical protein
MCTVSQKAITLGLKLAHIKGSVKLPAKRPVRRAASSNCSNLLDWHLNTQCAPSVTAQQSVKYTTSSAKQNCQPEVEFEGSC